MVVPANAFVSLILAIAPLSPEADIMLYPFVPQILPAFSRQAPQVKAKPEQFNEYPTLPSGAYVCDDVAHPHKTNALTVKLNFFMTVPFLRINQSAPS